MAAFLTVDLLRAHATPVFPHDAPGHADEAARRRPVLVMRWLVAPDGRLICRWRTDVSASFGSPPH
jgi:hypothetical protein